MAQHTWYNVIICIIVSFGAYSYGFGFGVFSATLGQPNFYAYMDLDPTSAYTAKYEESTDTSL
jgi:hypothetical protein